MSAFQRLRLLTRQLAPVHARGVAFGEQFVEVNGRKLRLDHSGGRSRPSCAKWLSKGSSKPKQQGYDI